MKERSNNNKSNVEENEKKRKAMIEKRETETKKENDRKTACLWLRNTLAGKAL